MAIDFPASPTNGQTHTVGSTTWTWDGTKWGITSGAAGATDNISEGNTSAEVIDTGSDGRFVVTTEGSERARVDSSGRLLVGTATSVAVGVINSKSQIEFTDYDASQTIKRNSNGDGGPQTIYVKSRGTSNGSNTVVQNGDSMGQFRFYGTDGTSPIEGASINAVVDGTPGANDMPGRLIFATTADGAASPTERLRITQAGHFGFFGTDPATEVRSLSSGSGLRLLNNSYQESAFGNSGYWIFNNTASSGTRTMMFFRVQGVDRGSITSDGSTTAFNTSSDYRLKEDWHPVANAVDRLQLLNPVNFAWKETGKRVDGFIAHEVQAVVPEAITGEKDAVDEDGRPIYQGIDQSKLVPLLTAALQEAVARIEAQDTTIASLEARLTALEGGN